jgi:hypothetical protein
MRLRSKGLLLVGPALTTGMTALAMVGNAVTAATQAAAVTANGGIRRETVSKLLERQGVPRRNRPLSPRSDRTGNRVVCLRGCLWSVSASVGKEVGQR